MAVMLGQGVVVPASQIRLVRIALLVIMGVALVLRVLAATDSFWLDEIWTYYLVQNSEGPWHIIANLPHSNNHILNSLFVRLMGEQQNWIAYRLLSVVTGTAVVWLIGLIAADHGWRVRIFVMCLAAISPPLVLYSAEARGYAPLLCFALLAYLNSPEQVENPSAKNLLIFTVASVLALMSHLTFAIVLAGTALSWFVKCLRRKMDPISLLKQGLVFFALPISICVLQVVNFYSNARPETGGQLHPLGAAAEIALSSMGIDANGSFVWFAYGVALLFLVGGIWLAGKQATSLMIIVICIPVAIFNVIETPYVFPRYFLVLTPFFLLTVGISLRHLWEISIFSRIITLCIIAATTHGATVQLSELYRYGKGDYPAAIAQLFDISDGGSFTVGSDHDFRNRAVLDFYTRNNHSSQKMTYVDSSLLLSNPPDFYIKHSFQKSASAPKQISLGESVVYRLVGEYPFSGHSGWAWWVYEKL